MKRYIAIVGSRTFPLPAQIWESLDLEAKAIAADRGRATVELFIKQLSPRQHVVVSRGARGVDSWAAELAEERGIEVVTFLPEWKKYGNSAGFKRNKLIVEKAQDIVAFWDGQSKGTLHTVRIAHKARKPYCIFGPDGLVKLAVTEEVYEAAGTTAPLFVVPKG